MAVIHVTEAEAARDLHTLLENVREGNEVYIDSENASFAILNRVKPRLLSDVIAALQIRGASATLDSHSGDDMEAVYRSYSEVDPYPRRASEAIAILEARGTGAKPDLGFADDVRAGIQSHQHELLGDRWE